MADNFSFAVVYGTDGPGHEGYHNPEIIEGIIDILSKSPCGIIRTTINESKSSMGDFYASVPVAPSGARNRRFNQMVTMEAELS